MKRETARWAARALLFVFVGAAACGNQATIVRKDYSRFEGEVVGGSRANIFFKVAGEEKPVPRDAIAQIIYPSGTIGWGVAFLFYGVINIGLGASQCDSKGASFCTAVFLPAAVGLSLLASGIITNRKAKRAALDTSYREDPPAPRGVLDVGPSPDSADAGIDAAPSVAPLTMPTAASTGRPHSSR